MVKKKTISVVAPASWIKEDYLRTAVEFLEKFDFNVKCADQVHFTNQSYMAGSDEDRIAAIHQAFLDPNTDIILCAKGGYGTSRILDRLDKKIVNKANKIFLGYSDITLLNLFLLKNAPLTRTYFSPNLIDIAYLNSDITKPTLRYFINFLNGIPDETSLFQLVSQARVLKSGKAQGELVGGTLTILMNTLGTPFEIETDNKILFIEDKREYAFKVERMLYHLKHCGKLDNIKGLIVGKFFETPEYHIPFGKSMEEMFVDFFKDYDIPIVYNFPLGHDDNKIPLPLNRKIQLDTDSINFGLKAIDLL